jgi:uncharacterized metal-binding protein YceD (DUF177 family)
MACCRSNASAASTWFTGRYRSAPSSSSRRPIAELARLDGDSELEVVLAQEPLDPMALVEDELVLATPFAPRHTECPTPDQPEDGRGEASTS